jgi:hypothetical protein
MSSDLSLFDLSLFAAIHCLISFTQQRIRDLAESIAIEEEKSKVELYIFGYHQRTDGKPYYASLRYQQSEKYT